MREKPTEISKVQSCVLASASFIAACLIVGHHINWMPGASLIGHYINLYLGREGLASACVPLYFCMSGYFLSGHISESGWWLREMRKRVRTLLLPMVLWIGVGFLYFFLRSVIAFMITGKPIHEVIRYNDFHWWCYMLGVDFSQGVGCNGPLWYLRALFLFVVFSPAIIWLLKRVTWIYICGLLLVCLFLPALYRIVPYERIGGVLYFGFPIIGVFYFSIGLLLRRTHVLMGVVQHRCMLMICGLLGVFALPILKGMQFSLIVNVTFVMMPFMVMLIVVAASWIKMPMWLAKSAFSLFVTHWFVVTIVPRQCQQSLGISICLFLASVCVGVISSVCFRKYLPRVGQLFLGAR